MCATPDWPRPGNRAEGATGHDLATGVADDVIDDQQIRPSDSECHGKRHDQPDTRLGIGQVVDDAIGQLRAVKLAHLRHQNAGPGAPDVQPGDRTRWWDRQLLSRIEPDHYRVRREVDDTITCAVRVRRSRLIRIHQLGT